MTVRPKPEAMTDDELRTYVRELEDSLDTMRGDAAARRALGIQTWKLINQLEGLLKRRQPPASLSDARE